MKILILNIVCLHLVKFYFEIARHDGGKALLKKKNRGGVLIIMQYGKNQCKR
jgi:hypothetical protein